MKICCILFMVIGAACLAQRSDANLKRSIDSMVVARMKESRTVGVAIGIVREGKIWYNKGYGVKKLGEMAQIDSLTNFHLASISKVFVGTAIMQLVEQGKISLDGKLLDYVPVEKVKDERMRNITIRQMLTHTSGFPDEWNYHWSRPKNDSLALGCYSKNKIRTSKLKFDPGARMRYSNPAFEILGHVIENVSGRQFDDFEQEHVLARAGLAHSSFDYYKIDPARRSTPHIKVLGKIKASKVYPYNREHGPSSTLNSCTYDMCKWIIGMLTIYGDSTGNDSGVIKHRTLRDMWSIQRTAPGPGESIGLAWFLEQTPLGLCTMHDGQDRGYLSLMNIFPEQTMGVVVLMNGSYPEGMVGLSNQIALFLGGKIKRIPTDALRSFSGEYRSAKEKWKIVFTVENEELRGKDGNYSFRLIPLGGNHFINPADLASFEFRNDGKSVLLFGSYSLEKKAE